MIRTTLVALLGALVLTCGRPAVQGSAVDPWGRGLEGVTVRLAESGAKAETDRSGTYSLEGQVGAATLRFSKPTYTTEHLSLDTSRSAANLVVPRVVLTPIPPRGISVIGDTRIARLTATAVNTEANGHYCHASSSTVALRAGKLRFVDRVKVAMSAFPTSRDGRIAVEPGRPVGNPVPTTDFRVGEEQLLIREMRVKEGTYAWVALKSDDLGGWQVDQVTPCYPFLVFSPSEHWRGKIPLTGDQ
jgi:hypothetical protein